MSWRTIHEENAMPMISVIIPVYKAEAYLQRCVDSILEQTFADFDLLLVDDGSPDNSGAICDAYSLQDSRVHVLHQKNAGVSAARNAGIEWALANSDSRWLTFVDSDDWVHPQLLEHLFNGVQEIGAKISICSFLEPGQNSAESEPMAATFEVWTPERLYLERNLFSVLAWGKLYHKSCFQGLRYPVGRLHEDEFTTYRLLFREKYIAFTEAQLYYYYRNTQGITKTPWTAGRLNDMLDAMKAQCIFLGRHGFWDAYDMAVLNYGWTIIGHRKTTDAMELSGGERIHLRNRLERRLKWAVVRHFSVYYRKNRSYISQAFPKLMKVYIFLKQIVKRNEKGQES